MTTSDSDEKFILGVKLFQQELYWDAIEQFKVLMSSNDHNLLDDVSLNLGITYMKLGLLDEAKPHFEAVFHKRVGDDQYRTDDQITGRPSDRAALGLFRIANAQGERDEAHFFLKELLSRPDAGIDVNGEFTSFFSIAEDELGTELN